MSQAIDAFSCDDADKVHAQNCGTDSHSSERSSPVPTPSSVPTSEPPKHWSRDQQSVLGKIQAYITKLRSCFPASSRPATRLPDPLRLFVCGGPGTGKSTVISQAAALFQENNIQIKCGAPTGVAAGSMRIPSATTLHTGWKIPRQRNEDASVTSERNEPLPFPRTNLDRLKEAFQTSINSGIPFATFLDEVYPTFSPPIYHTYLPFVRSQCSPAYFSGTFFSEIKQSSHR